RMKMIAPDLLRLGVVDRIVEEPAGGAHHDVRAAARNVGAALQAALRDLDAMSPKELVEDRYRRFRAMGAFLA
ncbi:MAG: acetyl-CoA carboxylase carboxyl transferase subunit alpha, partial [Polyangiaceae bacterium]